MNLCRAHCLLNTQHHRSEIFDNYTDMQEYVHFSYLISLKNKTNERGKISKNVMEELRLRKIIMYKKKHIKVSLFVNISKGNEMQVDFPVYVFLCLSVKT